MLLEVTKFSLLEYLSLVHTSVRVFHPSYAEFDGDDFEFEL